MAQGRFRSWWMSPPRTGMRLIICPWEYRHLRPFAGLHIGGGLVAIALGLLVLGIGGPNWKALGWGLAFCTIGVAHIWFGYWELGIADELE